MQVFLVNSIGNAFYHVSAGLKLLYDRSTRKSPEGNVLAAIGAVHLYMGWSFYKVSDCGRAESVDLVI